MPPCAPPALVMTARRREGYHRGGAGRAPPGPREGL